MSGAHAGVGGGIACSCLIDASRRHRLFAEHTFSRRLQASIERRAYCRRLNLETTSSSTARLSTALSSAASLAAQYRASPARLREFASAASPFHAPAISAGDIARGARLNFAAQHERRRGQQRGRNER